MFIYGSDGMAGQAQLQTSPGSGRAVSFENSGDQVSYATALAIKPSTAGGPRADVSCPDPKQKPAMIAAASTASPIYAHIKAGHLRSEHMHGSA